MQAQRMGMVGSLQIGVSLRFVASVAYGALLLFYAVKLLRFPQQVLADIRHPVRLNFLAAIPIAMLLLATSWLQAWPELAEIFWWAAAISLLCVTTYTVSSWIHHAHYEVTHVNPAWFIPVVGNAIAPIAGVHLAPPDFCGFFFSIGQVVVQADADAFHPGRAACGCVHVLCGADRLRGWLCAGTVFFGTLSDNRAGNQLPAVPASAVFHLCLGILVSFGSIDARDDGNGCPQWRVVLYRPFMGAACCAQRDRGLAELYDIGVGLEGYALRTRELS